MHPDLVPLPVLRHISPAPVHIRSSAVVRALSSGAGAGASVEAGIPRRVKPGAGPVRSPAPGAVVEGRGGDQVAQEARKARFPARGLRRGDRGEPVRLLQEKLAALGYEPGPADGIFGYVTEDALLAFQREYRLRPDGIAGPEVWNALASDLPRRRVVHVVKEGERLADIAEFHGLSVHALRRMNHIRSARRLRPGDRLVIRSSYVLAQVSQGVSPRVLERGILAQRRLITALASPPLEIDPAGEPAGPSPEEEAFSVLAREGGWTLFLAARGAGLPLAEVMCRRNGFQRLRDGLCGAVERSGARGVVLELGPVPAGRGGRVVAAVSRLSQALSGVRLIPVIDPLPAGWRSFFSDFDVEALARCAHHVAVGVHRWESLVDRRGEPSRERLERAVAAVARRVPPWKLLLGVPLDAWAITREGEGESLGYRAAVTEGYRCGVPARKIPDGYLALDFPPESPGRYARIIAPSKEVIGRFLALAHRFRFDGVYLTGVGGEDRRLWESVSHRLKAVRGE